MKRNEGEIMGFRLWYVKRLHSQWEKCTEQINKIGRIKYRLYKSLKVNYALLSTNDRLDFATDVGYVEASKLRRK